MSDAPDTRAREFFARLARTVVTHPTAVLVVTAALTALFTFGVNRLVIRSRFDDYIPVSHPYAQVDRELRDHFGGTFVTVAVVQPRTGTIWQPEVLQIVHDVTQAVRLLPGVIPYSVASLASPMVRKIEANDQSIDVQYLMREVPTTPEGVARVRAAVQENPLYRDVLVSSDSRAALISVDFEMTQTDADITNGMRDIARRFATPDVDIFVTGHPVVLHTLNEYVSHSAFRFALAFGVILAVLYVAFGSLQAMVLPMATALLSCGWGLGVVGLVGMPLDPFSTVAPILIVAIGAGHSAQILMRYYEEYRASGDNAEAVVASVAKMAPVMLAAGGTAAVAFGSLGLFPMPTLRTFGVVTSLGIVAAVVLELTFMPALRTLLPAAPPGRNRGAWLSDLLAGAARLVVQSRAAIGVGFGVLVVLSLLSIPHLGYEFRTVQMLPADTQGRRDFEAVHERFHGLYSVVIGFVADQGQAADPQVVDYIWGLEQELRRDPDVARALSYVDILIYANHVLGDAPAGDGVPRNRELAAQLLTLTYSDAYQLLLTRDFRKGALWVFLPTEDVTTFRRVIARAEDYARRTSPPPGVQLQIAGGIGAIIVAFTDAIIDAKLVNIGVVMLAVFFVAALVFGSFAGALLVVLPLLVTVVLQFGLMSALGISLSPSTATISAISVGIGADYAIYLLYRLREEYRRFGDVVRAVTETVQASGRAVVVVAAAIGAGYGTLGFSSFEAFRLTGILVAATMLGSCASALLLMMACAVGIRPKFIFEGRELGAAATEPTA